MLVTAVLLARLPDKRLTFRRGASDRNRTNDTGIFSPLLYRLSYRGIESAFIPALPRIRFLNRGPRKNLRSKCLWGRGESLAFITAVLLARLPDEPQDFRRATRIGLEPTTPSVTGWCSNQLSYRAISGVIITTPLWSGRRGSNSLPPPWQGGALPDELRPHIRGTGVILVLLKGGASDRNRTNDTGIFSPLLYRLSYRGAPDDDYYT